MRRFDFPIAPVVVGLILGPIAEGQLRRALAISLGDPMTLLVAAANGPERTQGFLFASKADKLTLYAVFMVSRRSRVTSWV